MCRSLILAKLRSEALSAWDRMRGLSTASGPRLLNLREWIIVVVSQKLIVPRSRQISTVFFRSGKADHLRLHQVIIKYVTNPAGVLTDFETAIDSVSSASWLLREQALAATSG